MILRQDLAPAASDGCNGTTTSLNISTSVKWTTAGSPYSVKCQINITTGGVLNIDPGVVVQFGGNGRIVASNGGAFRAIGNAIQADQPYIRARGPDSGRVGWHRARRRFIGREP